jgi:hypothetical protein
MDGSKPGSLGPILAPGEVNDHLTVLRHADALFSEDMTVVSPCGRGSRSAAEADTIDTVRRIMTSSVADR